MKKFAILFVALCMVAVLSSESHAQCARGGFGGGFYSGGGFGGGSFYGGSVYRPSFGVSYGFASPYVGRSFNYRPYYGGSFYRGGCGYRRY